MKNWLDKYEYGGEAGYTDIPFNYNSAWGGQFAMGGSLPGATGMMYARVGAPSNGPYAKKTKASAQKGKEIPIDIKTNPTYTQPVSEAIQFTKDWMNSPMYQKMLLQSFDGEKGRKYEDINRLRKEAINDDNINYYEESGDPSMGAESFSPIRGKSSIYFNTAAKYPDLLHNTTHELSHITDKGGYLIPKADKKLMESYAVHDIKESPRYQRAKELGTVDDLRNFTNYLNKPTETRARINSFRKLLLDQGVYNPFTQSFNKDMLNKYKQLEISEEDKKAGYTIGADPYQQLKMSYTDEEIEDMMNKISKADNKQAPVAENGMTFYQHGLDWKPKSISKNGDYIPKNQNAKYTLPNARDIARSMMNASESTAPTSKQLTTGVSKENMASSSKAMGKAKKAERDAEAKKIAERKAAKDFNEGKAKTFTFPTGETKSLDQMNWRDKAYISGKSLEGKGAIGDENSIFNEYLNPLAFITNAAGALGEAPYEAKQSNSNLPYLTAIGTPLIGGALGFNPLGSTIKFAKNPVTQSVAKTLIDIPRAESIKEAIGRVAGIPLKKDLPRMAAQDVKALRQVQEIGRLRATNSPITEQMKYGLENNLPEEHFQKVFGRSREEAQHLLDAGFGEQESAKSAGIRSRINLSRPRNQSPREMIIENLRNNEHIIHGAEHEVRNIAGDANINRADGIVNYDALSDEQLARLRDFAEEQNQALEGMGMGVTSQEPYQVRSDRVQDIVDRFSQPRSEYTDLLNPEAIERIRAYSRELDNQLPPPPEYVTLNEPREFTIYDPGRRIVSKRNINAGVNKLDKKLENLLINKIQNYPYHPGEVLEKVPSLNLSTHGGLKNVSKRVSFAPEGIQSGDVFTGSTNTSHSSYLPQLKQVFKYTKGDPQFLGYKPMNSLGFLSGYGYEGGDIAKYLNSEIDEQIKRGILPKDISRPFIKDESVMLPHYGVKQHKKGGVIKDDNGYWNPDNWGEIVEINSNDITMEGVNQPLLGISDEGDTKLMKPGKNYKFKGKKVTEFPMAQKGKTLPPVYVNDPNDPRLKLYNDSLSTFKNSQNPWFWEGTKVTTKQDYEKKLAEQRKFPYWAFDEDQYKKDKKKGKFKDFNDYVYDVSLADKPGSREADAHQRNVGKDFEELEEPIQKNLPDGRIKQYYTKYKGKLIDDQYSIYDPVTGSSSYYSGNNFMSLYNPNIKPIGHVYHAFDKPYSTGSINVSSEDSEYVNKVLKNKSKKKKDYTNYTYGANDAEIYKEPIQPVIYHKKKYNPNDPRLKQLQESFDRFHSSIKGKSKEETKQSKPEPTLKKKVLNIEPIHTSLNYTPQLKTIEHPNIELSPIEQGNYMVGYIDENNQGVDRGFLTPEQRDVFVKELEQRNLSSVQPYRGNITEYDRRATQTKKVNQKSTGGWLDKYN